MKKILQLTVCMALLSVSVLAQDTLKVDFKKNGAGTSQSGWNSMSFDDKAIPTANSATFTATFGSVLVTVNWIGDPILAGNYRAVSRASTFYKGGLYNVLDDYIAADALVATAGCNAFQVKVKGMAAGKYTWISYHHDNSDQVGQFYASATNSNGDELYISPSPIQITHSNPTRAAVAGNVTSSLDSVCKVNLTKIPVVGVNDELTFTFTNIYGPNAPEIQSHANKFVIINGFQLLKETETQSKQIAINDIKVLSQKGKITIQGNGILAVNVYSLSGTLVKQFSNTGDNVALGQMKKGIYIAQVKLTNGQIANKKIVVN